MCPMVRGAVLLVVALLALAGGTATSADVPPQVTLVGDSVATAITGYEDLTGIVEQGLRVDWQVAICRRVSDVSCPFGGTRPATLVDLVPALPAIGPVVVVELGYNDPETGFAQGLDTAMRELVSRGVQHVLWVTLHASRGPFPELNELLRAATERWPQLELVDWDAASADHPAWFQLDAIHLDKRGGRALAQLIYDAVTRHVDPLRVVRQALPPIEARRSFATRLRATGGTEPYSWRIAGGALPAGVHLLADGRLVGRPPRTARLQASVEVVDALGTRAFAPLSASAAR